MDVTKLVTEMQETLSTIHTTLASLNTSEHDAKLDELELKRDTTIKQLLSAFTEESEALSQKRKAEREEIAERRRREDEEREIRRRLEDEELAARDHHEDEVRDGKLLAESNVVEEETDNLMVQIEEEAQRVVEEGQRKLKALEEKRQELNRLIDEQLRAPLPQMPRRRSRKNSAMPQAVAAESKPPESMSFPESINNSESKALEPQNLISNEGSRPAAAAVTPSEQDNVGKESEQVQSLPRAVMDGQASENEDSSTEARQLERHLRPLFVHPVISKSGDIIHTAEQPEKKPPVEHIGIPSLDPESSEIAQSPQRDVTWWEEKRKAEAQALQAELDAHAHNITHVPDDAVQSLPLASQEDKRPEKHETLPPTVFGGNLGQTEGCRYPEEEYAEDSLIKEPSVTTELPSVEVDDHDGQVHENGPSPADVPLPPASRGSMSSIDGDTSFQSAREHILTDMHPPSAISDHTKSHENDHVSFADDTLNSYHGSYHQANSRDTSVLRTEASATPEREFSSEGEEHEVYSVSSHGTHDHEVPEVTVREAAKIALPPELDDSCSLSESSDHPSNEEIDLEDRPRHRYLGITDMGDVDEEEAVVPLQRVPSCQPEPEMHSDESEQVEHQTELSLPPPTGEDLELKSPLLMPIPENEAVHHRMDEDPLESNEEHVELGIRGNQPASSSLPQADDEQSSDDDDDDSVSHHHFDEDDYMHPDSTISLQPFRTDRSDRGSLAGDGGVQELNDSVSRSGEGDHAESDCGDRRSVDDHPNHSVLSRPAGVGSEDTGEVKESLEANVQAVKNAEGAPVPHAPEADGSAPEAEQGPTVVHTAETHSPEIAGVSKDAITVVAREARASVEMGMPDAPPEAGELGSSVFHPEGDEAPTDSEDPRRKEDMAHTPVLSFENTEHEVVHREEHLIVAHGEQPGEEMAVTGHEKKEEDRVTTDGQEARLDLGPVATTAPSEPESLHAHNKQDLHAPEEQHVELGVDSRTFEQPLPPTELHSPGPVYSMHESLADQLRRASLEEESEGYDDESSQLERTEEYTTTVQGESGLFDDDSDEHSDYGEEERDVDEMHESGAPTSTDACSDVEPYSPVHVPHQHANEHEDQQDIATAEPLGEVVEATAQGAQVQLEESCADTPTEQFTAEPEASVQAVEAGVTKGHQDLRTPSPSQSLETPKPAASEDASVEKVGHFPETFENQPAEAPVQVDALNNDSCSPEEATPAVPSTLEIQLPFEVEEVHIDDTHQQSYHQTDDFSVETQPQAQEQHASQADNLDQQPPTANVYVEPPALEQSEELQMANSPELPPSTAALPTIELPVNQHEPPRRHSWIEETDDFFEESDDEHQPSAEVPLMQSSGPSTQAYQRTSSPVDKGLAASRHNPDRPQTPEQEQQLEASADQASPSWHARNASSPQSMRSGSTLSSAPSSPVQTRDTHEPVIRGLVDTHSPSYTGRPRNDSTLTEYAGRARNDSSLTEYNAHEAPEPQPKATFSPGPLASRWGPSGHLFDHDRDHDRGSHRKSESGGGSLFQRMRSVFEPAQSASGYNNPPRASWSGRRNSSSRYSHDEEDDHERSGLLDDSRYRSGYQSGN